jgi:hypothetical protein
LSSVLLQHFDVVLVNLHIEELVPQDTTAVTSHPEIGFANVVKMLGIDWLQTPDELKAVSTG